MIERRDSERWAAILASAAEGARVRPDCPPPDRIWDAVSGALAAEERGQVIDHTIDCPACAEAWRLARVIAAEAPGQPAKLSSWKSRFTDPRAWVLPVAATFVIATGIVLVRQSWVQTDIVTRDPRGSTLASRLPDGQPLTREDAVLRWSGAPDGSRFEVMVTRENLDLIVHARGLERSEYRIPQETLAGLPANARISWRVIARTPDGATIASRSFTSVIR